MRRCLLLAIAVAAVANTSYALGASRPVCIYVAKKGNDSWTGRLAAANAGKTDGPFATLERARDEIRKMRKAGGLPKGGVMVEVRAGVYARTQPFELTEEDSGRLGAPIVYRSYRGETARLAGGKVLTGFGPVTDPTILKRLDPAARGQALQTDLRAQGITDFGDFGKLPIELFFQRKPMRLARWPNEGFVRIVDLAAPMSRDRRGIEYCPVGKIVYEGERPRRWVGEKDLWLHGHWNRDWHDERHKVESIDTEKRVISLTQPYYRRGYRKGQWYYAFNVLAELDQPGEWCLDREAGLLYFWPPGPLEQGEPIVSMLSQLIAMKRVSHVDVSRLTLEAVRGTAIAIAGGTAVRVLGCTIRNVGNRAVVMSGSTNSGVVGCDIADTGSGAVAIRGGDRKTLTPAGLYALNNHITRYGRYKRTFCQGIAVHGVGNRVAHNLIHDAPYIALWFNGNDHVIEFNEIHSVCYQVNDSGAVYGGYNWSMRGTVIRHNFIHHVLSFNGRGCNGVYLDDMFSGNTLYGNVFHRVRRAAFIGGGRDNVVENNLFVDCNPALHVDARGLGTYNYGATTSQPRKLKQMPYQQPPWSTHYPKLVHMLDDEPAAPKGNRIVRNVCQGGRWDGVHAKARPYLTLKDNLIVDDLHVVDAEHLNFQLRDDSPAFKIGFKRIPFDKIGLYQDEHRASWPVKHEVLRQPVAPPAPLKPSRKGPRPVFKAPRAKSPVQINGGAAAGEWATDPKTAMVCGQPPGGARASKYKSRAWAQYDRDNLYLLLVNEIDASKALKTEGRWGRADAAEIAFRDPSRKGSPIFNLRGFADGRADSVCDAGASAAQARKLGQAAAFAATIEKGRWVGEWRIPFAAAGMDPGKTDRLEFNINVRRTADMSWMVWTCTGAEIWQVSAAGELLLVK